MSSHVSCSFLDPFQRIREEKKEERRRRELERKRLRDEERRKWREEERRKRKEAEKMKRLEKPLEKDKDQVKDEPKIKVCVRCNGVTHSQFPQVFGVIIIITFCELHSS